MSFSASRRWLGLLGPLAFLPLGLRAQSWQWATTPGGSAGATSTIAATAAGSNGTTVVAGSFTGTITLGSTTLTSAGGADVFVARLSSTGAWTQAVRAGGAGDDAATALAVNPDGSNEVVVTGQFLGATAAFGAVSLANAGPPATADLFVARLSAAGTWTQAGRAGGPGSETTVGLALDGAGTATVAGSFAGGSASFGSIVLPNAGTGGSNDIFVASLSAGGSWTQAIGAGGPGDDTATALVVDGLGDALVAGAFSSPAISFGPTTLLNAAAAGVPTLFVARLGSTTGTWTRATGAGSDGTPQSMALALDPNGTLLVAGYYTGPTTHFGAYSLENANPSATSPTADVFVARLSPTGTWTQAVGGGGPADDQPSALAVDASGTASVGGNFRGATTAFGTATLSNTAAATTDLFVALLSRAGNWLQAASAGSAGNDRLVALSADGPAPPTAVGQLAGPASFGAVAVAAAAPSGFAARLGSVVTATRSAVGEGTVSLYPNPARAAATLAWVPAPGRHEPTALRLLDALGREVWRTELPARSAVLLVPVAGLPAGVYLVRTGATAQRLVLE